MPSLELARSLALQLPEAEERDHFGSPSFRVRGKIFAQLSARGEEVPRALVKLAPADQTALNLSAPDTFVPAPHWGRHGWTYVHLETVEESLLRDLLLRSWRHVAPRTLASPAPPGGAAPGQSRKRRTRSP